MASCRTRFAVPERTLAAVFLLPLCLIAVRLPGAMPGHSSKVSGQPALSILFSSEQNGYLTPCGCSKPMMGGMPRLATYLHAVASRGIPVKVQNGDLTLAAGRQDELKAETLVGMFSALKYDAINLGEKDFRLGIPYLKNLQGRFSGTFLSANTLGADGKSVFAPYTVLKRNLAGHPTRVVIVGVVSDQFAGEISSSDGAPQIEAPAAALRRLRNELLGAGEVRALLFHGPRVEATAIAHQFPIFNVIVFGHEGDHPEPAVHLGSTVLVCAGQDGKYIGNIHLQPRPPWTPIRTDFVALGPQLPEDQMMLLLKRAYLDRVDMEDLLAQVPRRPTENGDSFAGSAACASCHAAAYHIWKDSLHARALQTLADEGENKDPQCVVCHVVGLDRVSGFVSPQQTPHLQDVGCEDCHGAARRHVQNPAVKLPTVDALTCVRCHTAEQSPNFEFKTFWPKIRH